MKSLREVMDAQDWSTWGETPACVQKLVGPNDVCENDDMNCTCCGTATGRHHGGVPLCIECIEIVLKRSGSRDAT